MFDNDREIIKIIACIEACLNFHDSRNLNVYYPYFSSCIIKFYYVRCWNSIIPRRYYISRKNYSEVNGPD